MPDRTLCGRGSCSWRDDLNLARRRHRHAQLLARDAFDESMRRPRALLQLQLTPLDLEVVALVVEAFELDEQLTSAMLRVDGARSGGEHAEPQRDRHNHQQ